MELLVEKEEVWAAGIEDKPGSLAHKLAALADAGADLGFIIARRSHEKPGTGVVFVTPLCGDAEIEAASDIGFTVSNSLHGIRVEGRNRRGIAAQLTEKLGAAGINLRGLSAAVIGSKFVMHLALDTDADVRKAMKILRRQQ